MKIQKVVRGTDGDAEVNLQVVRGQRREQRNDEHLARQVAAFRWLAGMQERCHGHIEPESRDDAKGQAEASHAQLPGVGCHEGERTANGRHDQECSEQNIVTPAVQETEPAQRPVEDRNKERDVADETEQPGDDDAIPGFVVRAVGAGVARLDMRQFGRVEAVEGHPHGLRTVADEGAHHVHVVLAAVGEGQRLVREQHLGCPTPDQDAHLAGARLGVEEVNQAADVRCLLQKAQGGHEVGREYKEYDGHNSAADGHSQQRTEIARTDGADRQERKEENARDPAEPRAAALRPDDGDGLDEQHEEIGAAGQRCLPVLLVGVDRLADAHEAHKAGEDALQRQEEGHDEVRRQEDGVAGVGSHARLHIATPRQRIQPSVLDDAVNGDGQAGDDDGVLEAAQLD